MEILVSSYEEDTHLECTYLDCYFYLERNTNDGYSFANWYMIVKDETGFTLCDGWIDDSSDLTVREAFESACSGAMLKTPSKWPVLD
ncbi:hypothetical protein [Pseudoalteromonas luteoviolacea]|uniref:hypothetical protein n=1 Tax=Pseudoalteromonas luteoviolacea TaxID=43657 RepID=UPI001B392AE0|nr:hypothetical protein [Pseudoalteromonas luteoviolacea]MBQ4836029.1 hypothetical protein [Pseudoalteromonas luteoviolacea]